MESTIVHPKLRNSKVAETLTTQTAYDLGKGILVVTEGMVPKHIWKRANYEEKGYIGLNQLTKFLSYDGFVLSCIS